REEHFKRHGSRWSEFMRLPYFNLVRQSVIDPMHNLLLGVVKTQWHDRWIKTSAIRAPTQAGNGRELGVIHRFLESFETPSWAGKLPARVGEPAGGSLTADEYKFAMLTAWPLIVSGIPTIWDRFIDDANKDQEKAVDEYPGRYAAWQAEWNSWRERNPLAPITGKHKKKDKDPEPVAPKPPKVRMQAGEPENLLRLATALKIYCASSVSLYGASALKPNFHWAVHLTEQIQDFGPVYNFWAFLSERLNKVLKNSNVNNWKGGQIEISMLREFSRASRLNALVSTCVIVLN
ncbi:hypothetical protein CONPUDRAFT_65494, partial [Coniophora puteana RWD-64-598 SS2]